MQSNKPQNYISLREATKYCHYSQPYLRLRVGQRKLRAVKIGRNWVTTRGWVEEYIEKVEEYNNKVKNNKVKNNKIFSQPPDNLPVESLPASFIGQGPLVPVPNFSEIKFAEPVLVRPPAVRFGFLFALVFFLIISGAFLGKENLKTVYQTILPINLSTTTIVSQTTAIAFNSLSDFFETARNAFSQTIKNFTFALSRGINKIKEISKLAIKQPKEEGLVVIPSTGKDEEVIKKIKESFSDEVKVEPKDKTSGIIIPVFREREGEKYLYIMVPMKN